MSGEFMGLKNRFISILLVLCLAAIVVFNAQSGQSLYATRTNLLNKTSVRIWYTDDALTPYLKSKAIAYANSDKRKVRVEPTLVSDTEFLEYINRQCLNSDVFPDLYIVTNDVLEKAYYAGLAIECDNSDGYFSDTFFPKAALSAVRYNDKYIAYPLYFETSALVYNKTYLQDFAKDQIIKETQSEQEAEEPEETEETSEEGEEGAEGEETTEEGGEEEKSENEETLDLASQQDENAPKIAGDDSTEIANLPAAGNDSNAVVNNSNDEEESDIEIDPELIEQRVKQEIPKSIQGIIKFSGKYDAPDQIDIFKWDVTDIFYNYFFVGNYMDVGGDSGDNTDLIDIYNEDTIRCMKVYQQLNQFFAIDAKVIDYDSIVRDFADGKIVFTIATTDIFNKIAEANKSGKDKSRGQTDFEYGVAAIPNLTEPGDGNPDYIKTRTMSVTDCIVVNGYSEHTKEANDFAKYLCRDISGDIYNMSGKLAAHFGVKYPIKDLDTFVQVYAASVPMPKTIETSNLWMELEIAFTKIWDGNECNSTLKDVSETIKTQVSIQKTGEPYEEEYIMDPMDESLTEGLSEEGD